MNYDFDTVLSRTGTGCVKWDKPFACSSDQKVLPLWVADMDFEVPPELKQILLDRVNHSASSA